MDAISEARLQEVMPELAAKIHQLYEMLMGEGLEIRVTQALRSWQQQQDLYAKGRNPALAHLGPHGDIVDKSLVVTNCPGGHSYHNFGMAVDCAPDDPTKVGYQIDWNAGHPQWKRMASVGQSLGLDSGAMWRSFPDAPHFQLTGRFPEGAPNDEARQLFKDGGMQAVWLAAREE